MSMTETALPDLLEDPIIQQAVAWCQLADLHCNPLILDVLPESKT